MDLGHKTKMCPSCAGPSINSERRGCIDTHDRKSCGCFFFLEADSSYRNLLLSSCCSLTLGSCTTSSFNPRSCNYHFAPIGVAEEVRGECCLWRRLPPCKLGINHHLPSFKRRGNQPCCLWRLWGANKVKLYHCSQSCSSSSLFYFQLACIPKLANISADSYS